MADGVLRGTEAQMELEVVASEYVKRVEAFLRKSPGKTRAAAPGLSGSQEVVSLLRGISVRLDFVISLICSDVSGSSTPDRRRFVDASVGQDPCSLF